MIYTTFSYDLHSILKNTLNISVIYFKYFFINFFFFLLVSKILFLFI